MYTSPTDRLDVPETGDLARVRLALESIAAPGTATSLTTRQLQYAVQTARALGLVESASSGGSALTDAGRALLLTKPHSSAERQLLRQAIELSPLVTHVLPNLLSGASKDEIARELELHPLTALAPSTAQKRASALSTWSRQLDLPLGAPEAPTSSAETNPMLMIVHLSDIHIKTPSDVVLSRAQQFADAVAARAEDHGPAACIFVVTGDIAFSGTAAQYELALTFLTTLTRACGQRLHIPSTMVVCPGNHDCDFGRSTSVRRSLLESVNGKAVDVDILDACLVPQSAFRDFEERLPNRSSPAARNPLLHVYSIRVGALQLEFRSYNTAWASSIDEQQGSLLVPPQFFGDQPTGTDLVVTLFHHPYNWLESNNARNFRDHVERTSDVILTGHEHVPGRYEKIHASGEHVHYVEGAVLQESSDADHSQFHVLLLDMQRQSQETYVLAWNPADNRYHVQTRHPPTAFRRNQLLTRREFPLTEDYEQSVLDPEEPYKHPRLTTIRLSDIYTYPYLRPSPVFTDAAQGDELIRHPIAEVLAKKHLLICGQELTGKTCLSRRLTLDLHQSGLVPVRLDGTALKDTTDTAVTDWIDAAFVEAYGRSLLERYKQLAPAKKVYVIDDLHRSVVSPESIDAVIERLERRAEFVIVLAGEDFPVMLLDGLRHGHNRIIGYACYNIQELGHLLRYEFTEKWCFLGLRSTDDRAETSRRAQRMDQALTRAIGKNLLPAYPALILLCLQQLEVTQGPQSASMGSFGHLYEALVTDSLNRGIGGALPRVDLDGKRRFLAHFAYELFCRETHEVDESTFDAEIDRYLRTYDVDYPKHTFSKELDESGIILRRHGCVRFRYKYGYCFFVAEFLRVHLHEEEAVETVRRLCSQLQHEDSANTVLFLAHLSRNTDTVLKLLLATARARARPTDDQPVDIQTLLAPLRDSAPINELTLDDGGPEAHRRTEREERDRLERHSERSPDTSGLPPAILEYSASLRAIQILGQLLRSFPGSLPSNSKLELVEECYSLGVRAAAAVVAQIVSGHDEFVSELAHLVVSQRPELNQDGARLRQAVRRFLVWLCEAIFYSSILNVSDSVGLPALRPSYAKVLSQDGRTSYRLIDLAIKLDHFSAFPDAEVDDLNRELRINGAARNVLTRLVWRHLYLFPTTYQRRQRLCQMFGIRQSAPLLASAAGRESRTQRPLKGRRPAGKKERRRTQK
jgi:hypothetical protein